MSEPSEQGLSALLADVLTADRPPAEQLVRYARDPNSLNATERAEIEHHLAHTVGYRAELGVLKRVMAAQAQSQAVPAATEQRSAVAAHRSRARVQPDRPPLFERFRELWMPLSLAAAAAAAVLIAIRLTGLAVAPQGPDLARTQPVPADQPERIQLASLQYTTPPGAEPRPRISSATRSGGAAPNLVALVPEHVGLTLSAQPTLAWFIAPLPAPDSRFEFSLTAEGALDPLVSTPIDPPRRAGLQTLELGELGVSLEPGVYRWAVLLRSDSDPADFALAQGFVERVGDRTEVRQELAGAALPERALIAARSGLWYDALGAVLELTETDAPDPEAVAALRTLLASAGLSSLQIP